MAANENNSPDRTALPVLIEPEVFRAIYHCCKQALLANSGNRLMRDHVTGLIFTLKRASLAKLGHEASLEASALAALMRDSDYGTPSAADLAVERETPVERLYRLEQLGNPERNAARLIEQVWVVFERFLGARMTRYDQGGGGGAYQGVVPMSGSLSHDYTKFYSPWYFACRNRPPVILGTRKLRPVDLVFEVVVNRRLIKTLAEAYGVPQQSIIEIVRGELLSLASRMEANDHSTTGGVLPNASS